jgi:hypothetical protein
MRHLMIVVVMLVVSLSAYGQEQAVAPSQIPKAVMSALHARFPQARITKSVKEKEGGQLIYDLEFTQQGRKCEADIAEDGTYINYEKAIEEKDLPRAVRDAVEKRYPKALLKEIMEETAVKGKEEKLSAFEVVLLTASKRSVEVTLSPDGKILEDTGAKPSKGGSRSGQ